MAVRKMLNVRFTQSYALALVIFFLLKVGEFLSYNVFMETIPSREAILTRDNECIQ